MPASLTREEAAARADLLDVLRYDIEVDLTGLADGAEFRATSTATFRARTPGASTFVDVVADVEHASLNGRDLDLATCLHGRLPLPDLAADNVLVVRSVQSNTAAGQGVLRTVDPTDGLVYVWTTFEPDEARRLWACFDQPDLKAEHRFVVDAPASWTVTSNTAPTVGEEADGVRRWTFAPTPRLSPYVTVVNAGPFTELRSSRGGYDLGLFCRRSLAPFLQRDAEELFDLTARGLAWFGERFAYPFPQERYDQVFVPNMGGAMENWGGITHTDAFVFRSAPTSAQRAGRASTILHEMAHMWFGDLVTMRWWDDLWLNEAFASWAATWAQAGATEYTDAWAEMLLTEKLRGYAQDMGPATHPIRGEVPDVQQAMANFDDITYRKGESVLHQLSAYVGEEAFVEGLRAYFARHAWGNTVLDDLIAAVAGASGRDLTGWTAEWLDRAGTDTLVLEGSTITATAPDGGAPRPHRFKIAGYDAADGALVPAGRATVEVDGPTTDVELPAGTVHQLNAGDLTFAAVRTDPASQEALRAGAGGLPDALSRALEVTTAWDRLVKGELDAAALVDTAVAVLGVERSAGVAEPILGLGLQAAELWAPAEAVPALTARIADAAAALLDVPDLRLAALRALAATAVSETHLALVAEAAEHDVDLGWRLAARRAESGRYDEAEVAGLAERDPDPDSSASALAVRAARPDAHAKAEAWQAIMVDRRVPAGPALRRVADRFWRPLQADALAGFPDRYLDAVGAIAGGGMLSQLGLLRAMFPAAVADAGFLERASAAAQSPDVNRTVRTALLSGVDTARRMLRARAA